VFDRIGDIILNFFLWGSGLLLLISLVILGVAIYDEFVHPSDSYKISKKNWECTQRRLVGKIFVCSEYSRR
jgi:hypothetical protein